jgi:hypothetical protein
MGQQKNYRVVKDYKSPYPDPLEIAEGEVLRVSQKESDWPGWVWCTNSAGTSGWIPESCVERTGTQGRVLRPFTTKELSVRVGEELSCEEMESGWIWCTNSQNQHGWVPVNHVQQL